MPIALTRGSDERIVGFRIGMHRGQTMVAFCEFGYAVSHPYHPWRKTILRRMLGIGERQSVGAMPIDTMKLVADDVRGWLLNAWRHCLAEEASRISTFC